MLRGCAGVVLAVCWLHMLRVRWCCAWRAVALCRACGGVLGVCWRCVWRFLAVCRGFAGGVLAYLGGVLQRLLVLALCLARAGCVLVCLACAGAVLGIWWRWCAASLHPESSAKLESRCSTAIFDLGATLNGSEHAGYWVTRVVLATEGDGGERVGSDGGRRECMPDLSPVPTRSREKRPDAGMRACLRRSRLYFRFSLSFPTLLITYSSYQIN